MIGSTAYKFSLAATHKTNTMSVDPSQQAKSQEQFSQQSHHYAESLVHSSGESLQLIQQWASTTAYVTATDIGTGAGFTAAEIAPFATQVIATDITSSMLLETRLLATKRDISNLDCLLAAAECLPFADGSVGLVTCRVAAHHFQDLDKAIEEWYRVLQPEGLLLMADTVSPEDLNLATWMNEIEFRRDPSHVRNLSPSEWLSKLEHNGLQVEEAAVTEIPMFFDEWVLRSGTPEGESTKLLQDFQRATPPAKEEFAILQDDSDRLSFKWTSLVIRAKKK